MIDLKEVWRTQTIQARVASGNIAASDRLDVPTLAYLEHPTDSAAREKLRRFLTLAANTGSIRAEAEPVMSYPQRVLQPLPDWQIERQEYRRWREQCPQELLSALSLIARWMPPKKPPRPTVPSRDIKARLQAGESIEAIRIATGASKHAIRSVKTQYGIPDAAPGPKPR